MESSSQQSQCAEVKEPVHKEVLGEAKELYKACEENEFERAEYILMNYEIDAKIVRQAFLHCCFYGHIALIQLFSKLNKLSPSYAFDFSHGFRLAWDNEHFAAARTIFKLQPSLTLNLR